MFDRSELLRNQMTTRGELLTILDRMTETKVLVVGDVMLDRYWWGNASRLSPEAPVPVVALKKVSHIPGGAANVAANIAGLGATALLAGLIGDDDAGISLRESLEKHRISTEFLVSSETRQTTTKTRVLVHNQQIARVDDETDAPLSSADENALIVRAAELLDDADVVVLSDYAKGSLTAPLMAAVIGEAKRQGKTVLVDPKSRDFSKYSGASMLTPNLAEAMTAAGIENGGEEQVDEAAERILAGTSLDSLLITLGEHGMKLFRTGQNAVHFPSMARQVFDVTGAGDTVVALLAAALGANARMDAAISFANIGAGLAVEKVGTSIVDLDELRLAIDEHMSHFPENQ
jgi:rfaE bifunctional protein kinase chain/domain